MAPLCWRVSRHVHRAALLTLVLATFLGAPVPSSPPLAGAQWIADEDAPEALRNLWVSPSVPGERSLPMPLFRREFRVRSSSLVKRATLVITSLGSYQAFVDGRAVSKSVMVPDWSDYRYRVYYQSYDVTGAMTPGEHVIGVMLGEGWYGSPMLFHVPFPYGAPPIRMKAVLRIIYANGESNDIVTDRTWLSAPGPIVSSQIYDGEFFDARLLSFGWDRPHFDARGWRQAVIAENPSGLRLEPQAMSTIQRTATLLPVSEHRVGPSAVVYDIGQNIAVGYAFGFAGRDRLRCS